MKIMTYLDPRQTVWPGVITAACLAAVLMTVDQSNAIIVTAVVAWLCMMWWIFEPIPIPVTSLLPLSVLPMAGVLTVEQVAGAVGSPLIILLLGGFSALSRYGKLGGAPSGGSVGGQARGRASPSTTGDGLHAGGCRSQYVDLQYGIGTDANARCDGRAGIL